MESARDGGEHIAHSPTVWTELHPNNGNDLPVAVAVVVGELYPTRVQLNNQGYLRNLPEVIALYGTPYTGPPIILPFRLHPNAPKETKIKIGRRLVSWMNERGKGLRFDFGYSSRGTCHTPEWRCDAIAYGIHTSSTSYTKKEANFASLYDWFGLAKYGFAWNHADIVEQLNGANGEATGWDDLDPPEQPPRGFIHNPHYSCDICEAPLCCNSEEKEIFPHYRRFDYHCRCTGNVCFGCAARAGFTKWLNGVDSTGAIPRIDSKNGKVKCPFCAKTCRVPNHLLTAALDNATLLAADIRGGSSEIPENNLSPETMEAVKKQVAWRASKGYSKLTKQGHVGGLYSDNAANRDPRPTLPGVKFVRDPTVEPPAPFPNNGSDYKPIYTGNVATIVAWHRKAVERRRQREATRAPSTVEGTPVAAVAAPPRVEGTNVTVAAAPVTSVTARLVETVRPPDRPFVDRLIGPTHMVPADAGPFNRYEVVGEMDPEGPQPTITRPRAVPPLNAMLPPIPRAEHTPAQPPPTVQPAEPAPAEETPTPQLTREQQIEARLRFYGQEDRRIQTPVVAAPGAPATTSEEPQEAKEDTSITTPPAGEDVREEPETDDDEEKESDADPAPRQQPALGPPAAVPPNQDEAEYVNVWYDVDTFRRRRVVAPGGQVYGTFGPGPPPAPVPDSLGTRLGNFLSGQANRIARVGREIFRIDEPALPVAAPPPLAQPGAPPPAPVNRPQNPPGPQAVLHPRGAAGVPPQRGQEYNDPTLNHRGERWDQRAMGTLYTTRNDITESLVYRVPTEVHLGCMLFVFMSAEQYQWYYLLSIILYGILYAMRRHLNYVGLVVAGLIIHAARGEENANEVWDFIQSMFTTHNRTLFVTLCLFGILIFYLGLGLDLFYFKFNRLNHGKVRLRQSSVVGRPLIYDEIWSRYCRLIDHPHEPPHFPPDPKFIGATVLEFYPNLFEYSFSLRASSKDSEGLMRYIQSDIMTLTARADRPLDPLLVLNTVTLVHQAILTGRTHNSYHAVTDEKAVPSIVW